MNTLRCPQCNLVNWATAAECKRCRLAFQAVGSDAFEASQAQFGASDYSNQQYQQNAYESAPYSNYGQTQNNQSANNYQNNYQPNYQYGNPPQNQKSGLAIASLVLGILAFVSWMFLVGLLFAPIGFILAIAALVKAKKKPNEYGGKGFAIAGLILSSLVFLFVPVIAAIAIPNLMAARRAANEGSAISSIRTIAKAETSPVGCLQLSELAANGLISENLADGENNGYRFSVKQTLSGCEINATPVTSSHGTRSFYYSSSDGEIRAASKNGAPAGQNDPALSR